MQSGGGHPWPSAIWNRALPQQRLVLLLYSSGYCSKCGDPLAGRLGYQCDAFAFPFNVHVECLLPGQFAAPPVVPPHAAPATFRPAASPSYPYGPQPPPPPPTYYPPPPPPTYYPPPPHGAPPPPPPTYYPPPPPPYYYPQPQGPLPPPQQQPGYGTIFTSSILSAAVSSLVRQILGGTSFGDSGSWDWV